MWLFFGSRSRDQRVSAVSWVRSCVYVAGEGVWLWVVEQVREFGVWVVEQVREFDSGGGSK